MNAVRCESCGQETEFRREGSTQGWYCKHCSWAMVTSYIPAIYSDLTEYEVRATGGDFQKPSHVRVVAEVSEQNFLGARKLLQEGDPVVYKGKAPEVVRVQATLAAVGIRVRISPPFPHPTEQDR